jgi:hypothetical protein
MKTLALAAVAAALFTMPASAQTAQSDMSGAIRLAQADINVRIGGDGVRVAPRRHYHHPRRHYYRGHHASCRTVVVKERRGNTVITKRIKRC